MYTIVEACKKLGWTLSDLSVAVQGFGKVGGAAAQMMSQQGCKIVGASDVNGAIANPRGLNVPELIDYQQKNGTIKDFPAV